MNDEELPRTTELASAYLDGELDPVDRASAQTDPSVMSMVDSFSRVRALLGKPEDVDAQRRSAAIAAALAEFDAREIPSAAAAVVAPRSATITSLQSRRMRSYRVLTGVAAALAIGVIGVAALNASRGTDSKTSSASESTSAAAGAAADSATELPQLKVAAPGNAGAPTAAASATQIEGQQAPGPAIDSRDALAQYVAQLEGASAPPAPATSNQTAAAGANSTSCLTPDQTVLAPIVFQGTPAYAVRDRASGALQAVDAADCRVLVHVP
jgi:hypothetical protein